MFCFPAISRLAQLVKDLKQRRTRDEQDQLTLAIAMENEVTTYLENLPSSFRLDMNGDNSDASSPMLVAQRCELAAVANMLILKLFNPFLKRSPSSVRPPHHAAHACSDAAHAIVHASGVLHRVFRAARPSAYLFYSFGRQLFHGAVISASVAIHSPQVGYMFTLLPMPYN